MTKDDLAEALRQRGFSPSYSVRLCDFGRRKIQVIKIVRELTGWGLKQTKDAVEAYATILVAVTRATAELATKKLEEVGASVEIDLDELRLHAFDPEDPRRGDQPIERLRVVGLGLALDHGKLGEWALGALEEHLDGAELLAAIDEHRAAWAKAGRREAASELALLEQVSARDLAAEDRLRASTGEDRRREAQVYGDWLQSVGDPRGQIAAAALAADEASEDPGRRAQLDELLDTHRAHLIGPAKALLEDARRTWCGPIVDTLSSGQDEHTCEQLAELLATPACACLRSLRLEGPQADHTALTEVLHAASCAPGLRELRLPEVRLHSFASDRFARLETLSFPGGFETLGPARLPELRELEVTMDMPLRSLAKCFVELDAPRLERFTLRVGVYDFWDQNYGPLHLNLVELLAQPAFAKLRSLTLAHATDELPLMVGFAERLARVPAIATLERIDLRGLVMTPACRSELEACRARLPGLQLPD